MARSSIRFRLTVLISGLLVAAGLLFTAVAYFEVVRALERAGGERLRATTAELSRLLAQSVTSMLTDARRIADAEDVKAAADTPRGTSAALPSSMKAYVDRSRQNAIWLLRPDGSVIVGAPAGETPPSAGLSSDEAIGPLIALGGGVGFTVASPVAAGGAKDAPAAVLVIRRALSSSSGGSSVERIIGTGTNLKLGNADGSLWTDLAKRVDPPAAQVSQQVLKFRDGEGQVRLGTAVPIPRTPWLVWLAVPRAGLLQPARTLLGRILPIAVVLVVFGALAVLVITARLTRPIERLAGAADDIAAGRYARRADVEGPNEIARLGVAFNTMASQVERSHRDLEQRVEERTRDLEHALAQLTDAQQELVRKERLAMLGQLASGVGHELRNPLGVMTNAIYYLEMVQPDAPEDVREYLGILRHQIGLSEKIVSDLLDFARIKPPQVEAIDVATFLDNQIGRVGAIDTITIERRVPEGLPPVTIDPVQIGQVLLNLLTNAAQAIEGGGTISVSARQDGATVVIEVSDSGPGVPPELGDRIFEPLFTTKPRGIGLGLSVSRSLAEANGGRLELARSGRGAVFALTLPAAIAAATQEAGC